MQKLAISLGLAVLASAVVFGGIYIYEVGGGSKAQAENASEIRAIQDEIATAREDLTTIKEQLARLETSQGELAIALRERPVAIPTVATGEEGGASPQAASISTGDLKTLVAAVLQNERQVQQEEREQQREDMRTRMEERQKQMEAFKEGPYGEFNTKVNSLASVLNLDENQKNAYYELSTAYWDKFQKGVEEFRAKREQSEGENAESDPDRERGRGRGGRGGGGGEEFRELLTGLQEDFNAEVEGIFSAEQLETYNKISSRSTSIMNQGSVSAPGEQSSRFSGMFGGGGDRGGFSGRGGGGRRGR